MEELQDINTYLTSYKDKLVSDKALKETAVDKLQNRLKAQRELRIDFGDFQIAKA